MTTKVPATAPVLLKKPLEVFCEPGELMRPFVEPPLGSPLREDPIGTTAVKTCVTVRTSPPLVWR